MKKAVLLLSGGLDSSTVLAIAKAQGFEVHCISFSYGQRHNGELEAAKAVAETQGAASHQVVPIDLRAFGGSALTDDIEVPKGRDEEAIGGGIPITYVPARNTIFLSFALAKAEAIGAYDIFLGVNAVDFSGYPDCRPAFVEAFERLANLATKAADGGPQYGVHAPLIHMSKAEIVKEGTRLGVDYGITRTCYDPVAGKACGACDACVLRRKGFEDAGVPDPTVYAD